MESKQSGNQIDRSSGNSLKMADVFDVEAILEEKASKSSKPAEEAPHDSRKSDRRSSRDRKRDSRDRDRRRDDSRERSRRRRSPSDSRDGRRRGDDSRSRTRDRDRDRSRERDRDRDRERDRPRDKDRETAAGRDRSSVDRNRRGETEKRSSPVVVDRDEQRKQREIDDLTKDQRTIFVGQLTKKVGERDLERFFEQIGHVRSVIMLRDKHSGAHKGFAYVEMADLDKIPDCLLFNNVVPDFQKFPILVKASEAEKNFLAKKDPFSIKNIDDPNYDPETRIYLGNIHVGLDENALKQVLDQFGPTESIKIHRDNLGNSKGFAFVKYASAQSAQMAMKTLGGLELAGRPLKVGPVTDHRAQVAAGYTGAPMINSFGADASGNWKLDADEGGAGMSLNSQSRQMLMAKLGEKAGIEVPQIPMAPMAMNNNNNNMIPPVDGMPSNCFMVVNLFDPATESAPGWDEDIREDVTEECRRFGPVDICKVETRKPGGIVLVRMQTIESASSAANALHGRFFAGRQIVATFLDHPTFLELLH
eukprot:gene3843-4197_t